MHFDEFDSKLEKCKGIKPCILMNLNQNSKNVKVLAHAFWWILTQNSKNVKVLAHAFWWILTQN